MNLDHAFLVLLAKSLGLLCFIVASGLVLYYALRPSAREGFERAGRRIVEDTDDRPAPRASDTEDGAHHGRG